jgi:hypothetical protein
MSHNVLLSPRMMLVACLRGIQKIDPQPIGAGYCLDFWFSIMPTDLIRQTDDFYENCLAAPLKEAMATGRKPYRKGVRLTLPGGVDMASRLEHPPWGVRARLVRRYDLNTDTLPARIDAVRWPVVPDGAREAERA